MIEYPNEPVKIVKPQKNIQIAERKTERERGERGSETETPRERERERENWNEEIALVS